MFTATASEICVFTSSPSRIFPKCPASTTWQFTKHLDHPLVAGYGTGHKPLHLCPVICLSVISSASSLDLKMNQLISGLSPQLEPCSVSVSGGLSNQRQLWSSTDDWERLFQPLILSHTRTSFRSNTPALTKQLFYLSLWQISSKPTVEVKPWGWQSFEKDIRLAEMTSCPPLRLWALCSGDRALQTAGVF